MTSSEFNEKWKGHLEPLFYGLAINDPQVAEYLDKEFTEEVKTDPQFQYSQIKLKFGYARVYTTSTKTFQWEEEINRILKGDDKNIQTNSSARRT